MLHVQPTPEQHEWVDRGWYVVTEFEQTPSINFERTVALAKTHPTYTPLMDERNILVYRNIYRPEDLLQFEQMYKLIKNWKGSKLYLKGNRVEFDMIGSGIQCYIQTVITQESPAHLYDTCQRFVERGQDARAPMGCIGCRRSHVSMEWNPEQESDIPVWFAFGRLDENRVYQIKKEELTGAVIGELVEYRYCPLLDIEAIRAFPQRLPNSIDPRKDREWVYNRKAPHERSKQRLWGGVLQEPDVLPRSAEDYAAYLNRIFAKHQHLA